MNSTEKKIKDLEKEIELIKKYLVPLEKIGIEASIVSNSFISIYNGIDTLEKIQSIIELYPPSGEFFELGFAGRDSIKTFSPFSFNVSNYSHCETKEVTIEYKSDIPLHIKCDINLFQTKEHEITKQVKRGGDYHTIVERVEKYIYLGTVQAYHGSSYTSYAKTEEQAAEFLNALGLV